MDWFILIFLVPLILVPLVLLGGFAGCASIAFRAAPAPPAPPPPAPTNLVATAADTKLIKLSWTDKAGGEAKFSILRAEDGSTPSPIGKETLKGATSYDDKFEDLPPGTETEGRTFLYRVRATLGPFPSFVPSTPSNQYATTTLPKAPTNLVAIPVDTGRIDLSWKNNSGQTKDFTVKRTALEDPGTPVATFPIKNKNSFSDITGLTEGRKYQYEVFAAVQGYKNNIKDPNDPVLSTVEKIEVVLAL